jgi:hypothetical protein
MDSILAEKFDDHLCDRQGRMVLCVGFCWKEGWVYALDRGMFATTWQTAIATLTRLASDTLSTRRFGHCGAHRLRRVSKRDTSWSTIPR